MAKDTLLEEAKKKADKLFGDTSVSRAETRERLEELVEHIKTMLETLNG